MAGRWMMASIQATFSVMPALVYGLAGWFVFHGNTSISAGTLVAFTALQTRLFFPVGSLLNVQADVQTSLALFDRVFEYLDLPVEIDEVENPVSIPRAELRGEVVFDDVDFSYEEGQPTLQGVSFVAEAGTRVAIVGETGSGKTTLGYLVARLYDVTGGSIRIDDVDVRELSFKTLREAVGVVSQETYLFHGTVMDNLRFARPDASDDEVHEAARAARIHDHLMTLPNGYDTIVGERGYRFSGGEKQRMAIARAILRDPPILVLDEATSALDVETERAVAEALDRLSQGRTTIAIAHRLSTILRADLIVVVEHGRIIERGRHDELLAHGGLYARLYREQFLGVTGAEPAPV
jgi:ATP-binding cassette subfamily B protein